jgi:putative heme-binding domain-containing protein
MKMILGFIVLAGGALAQHEADIQEGQRMFRDRCVICHGPEGTVPGGIDLLKGKFKRASSDADLVKTIRGGIPNTAMTPLSLTENQAMDVVAYLRSTASAPTVAAGNAVRGKTVFEGKGGCQSCHRVRGTGSRYAPDLSDIGALRRPDQMQRSLLDPDAEVLSANRILRAVPKTGAPVTGRILNQDTFTVQLMDAKEQLISFDKAGLRELSVVSKSPMPSVRGKLTNEEVADLLGYLVSLKGSN